MTPKEKAIDLVNKFYSRYNNVRKNKTFSVEQKRMAIIAVDEIIKSGPSYPYDIQFDSMPHFRSLKYWQEVKQEIERL